MIAIVEHAQCFTEGTPAHALLTLFTLGFCVEILPVAYPQRPNFRGGIKKLKSLGWEVRQFHIGAGGRELYFLEGVDLARNQDRAIYVVGVQDWVPCHEQVRRVTHQHAA